ncbi:uncharacterized protein LOC114910267 [Scleropages formosus]|uniref:uncharacterized protein LOC114910267 n=1 Tax=Scleropages formosus TaxID=113540 RepID=UPI0010FAC12F|nr:uncharacterized protein LOC114910267 [Scleropages formosus]
MVRSSTAFITVMLKYIRSTVSCGKLSREKASFYLKEILHSIFFLGYINRPRFYPEDVLSEENALNLRETFPDMFQTYMTHLPSRPPYSALLDVVVETTGTSDSAADQDEYEVLDKLLDLNKEMYVPQHQNTSMASENAFCLASAVVSYCFFLDFLTGQKTKKYFGAPIACKGKAQREIFIDLSCIKTWNRNVALSVCLMASGYPPILLPQFVHSAAFRILSSREEKQASAIPCISEKQQSCGQRFEGNASSGFSCQRSTSDTVEHMSSQAPNRELSFR